VTVTCSPPFALAPALAFPEMTSVAALPAPRSLGTALMPFTMNDDFFDGPGGSLPDCSVAFLNRVSLWSARHPEFGFVPSYALARFSSDSDQIVRTLLSVGIAERAKRGGIRIVEGCGITVTVGETEKPAVPLTANARRQSLHRLPALKKQVRARDADCCRYCSRRVRWGKGRAPDSATWDWIDPLGEASAENVVTACKACSEAKGGRSPEEAGMILLPEPRNASCNASDLQNNNSPPTRNASKRDGNANTGDRSRSDLSPGSKSKSRSKSARARGPAPGTPEFRLQVTAKFAEATGIAIGSETADVIAADVLGAREGVDNPLLYVQRAIDNEPDPVARWLPAPATAAPGEPGRPKWCGKCIEDDHGTYNEDGSFRPCPDCHPKFRATRRKVA
jgi:5-methylcytosine-specific restriction endonuclease McrA